MVAIELLHLVEKNSFGSRYISIKFLTLRATATFEKIIYIFIVNLVDFYRLLSAIFVSIKYLFLIFCVFFIVRLPLSNRLDNDEYWSVSSSR